MTITRYDDMSRKVATFYVCVRCGIEKRWDSRHAGRVLCQDCKSVLSREERAVWTDVDDRLRMLAAGVESGRVQIIATTGGTQ